MTSPTSKRTVLITGCTAGGIGSALALEFHERGLRVFATARRPEAMSHLQELGIETLSLDVASPEQIRAAVEEVSRRTGGVLDYLVNNAGAGYQCPLLDADLDQGRHLFEVNVWGVLSVTQAFGPLLVEAAKRREEGSGGCEPRVVNIGSVVARVQVPWGGLYNASKGALASLNDCLRQELRPLGVGVVHIITGGIATKFYGNSAGQILPPGSVYAPVAAHFERGIAGHTASTLQTVSPEAYARKVVNNVLSRWPTTTQWVGGQTWIGHMGIKLGWDGARDLIVGWMCGMYGMRGKYLRAVKGKRK